MLLTTTAAGTLLCALWFVPSANATGEAAPRSESATSSAGPAAPTTQGREAPTASAGEPVPENRLADTGAGVDTTPYVIGGTVSLAVGAGFVAYSVRRAGTAAF